MKYVLCCLSLLAAPLLAQTTIGGGTCSSATLSGNYAVSINGRQVTAAGAFTNVLQVNGVVNFDGQSVVKLSMTESTLQTTATPLNWSGTYSVQANCAAAMTITSGGSANFNLAIYNGGTDIVFTGSDSTYSYSGSADNQPASGCSTSALTGTYTYSGTGYNLSGSAVTSAGVTDGLMQFDGLGNLTLSLTFGTKVQPNATGTYSLSSNCLGTGTVTISTGTILVAISVENLASGAPSDVYVDLAENGKMLSNGAMHTVTGQVCSAATLTGPFALSLGGRNISAAGTDAGAFQGSGTATFDGVGAVTLAGTFNSNTTAGKPFSYSGTYTLPANCSGTITLTQGDAATLTLVVWSSGAQYNLGGADSTYVLSGNGTSNAPVCATPTLSGNYVYNASGPMLSGTAATSLADESGVFQFDGQGGLNAVYTITSSASAPVQLTSTGSYTVASSCLATATLTDSTGATNNLNFVIEGVNGQNTMLLEANPRFIRTGASHAAFYKNSTNSVGSPAQSITNVASYGINATPPGSVFAIFGQNLATTENQPTAIPLPTKALTTTVTVNNEAVPLFYVSETQIDAQMPWDVATNAVASVIVKNTGANGSTSNAAAVFVPATGAPGISVYSNNRAVVVNVDGQINSTTDTASVGDEVVLYFTGGGPVNASGKLVSGAEAPATLSPVTDPNASVSVGGVQALVKYIGLTPLGIGLYQANFIVPQLSKGAYPIVLTISGNASNAFGGPYPNPLMNVGN